MFYDRFTKAQAWIDLLLLANHKPNSFDVRGNEVNVERGQLGYSIKTLSRRWQWNERTVDKFLRTLQNRQMIQYRKNHITTVITIQNYNRYQGSTEQNTEQMQNRIHTNKNDKNEKNIYSQWFDFFWDSYPRKVSKKKAESIFLRVCKEEKVFQEIVNSLNNQKQSEQWTKNNGQFIPHPSTWLNGERWKDEAELNNNQKTLEL